MRPSYFSTFLITCVQRFKTLFFVQGSIALIWSMDTSLRPILLKEIIDALEKHALCTVRTYCFLYVALSAFIMCLDRLYDYVGTHLIPKLRAFVGHRLAHGFLFFQTPPEDLETSGALTQKITQAVNDVPDLFSLILYNGFSHGMALTFAFMTLITVHGSLGTAVLLWGLFLLMGTAKLSQKALGASESAAHAQAHSQGVLLDTLHQISTIALFRQQERESRTIKERLQRLMHQERHRELSFLRVVLFQSALALMYQGFCFFFLLQGINRGTMTTGQAVLVLTLNLSLQERFWSLCHDMNRWVALSGRTRQALHSLMTPPQKTIPSPRTTPIVPSLSFDHVSFHLPQGQGPLLQDIHLTVPSGTSLALVGPSGSGKTLMVRMILGQLTPTKGRVLFTPSKGPILDPLQYPSLGAVNQNPQLFQRSFRDNISYGQPHASLSTIETAARMAQAHTFIQASAQGYETLIGPKGMILSGGQRQRIALARLFLQNPSVVILDEITTHLDATLIQDLWDVIVEFIQNKTAIMIDHHLSLLTNLDQTIVLNQGKIVQRGHHETLVNAMGCYQQLWKDHTRSMSMKKQDGRP